MFRPLATRRALLTALSGLAAPRLAAAQEARSAATTILVPYGPGTGPDILARLVAQRLQQAGSTAVVDNRPGASGNIASQAVARAAPDGRTLLLQTTPFVINPSLLREVPYDPVASFTPIAKLATSVLVLAVRPELGVADMAGFVARAKASPGSIDYASPGIGTPQHMAMALLAYRAGLALNHIPYRTSPPAIQDLLGGRVMCMALPIHAAVPLAQHGALRLLAVFYDERVPTAPAVPTMAEAGLPGLKNDLWYGLLGPAGMAPAQVEALQATLLAWLAEPATRQALVAQGLFPTPATGAAFAALIRADLAMWAETIRAAGITAD